jgi:nitrite reductase/ring-hydroxylating ferredoxin subunit
MKAELRRVCAVADVADSSHMRVDIPGIGAVAVYNVESQFYVTDDACTHLQASLGDEGFLEGHVVQCTWHNGKFDIRTGEVLGPPCPSPLRTYPVTVKDGAIFVSAEEE